ncbi:hypothetical protein LINPERPRIM_LOCUS35610 [Linum perenne]
MQRRREDTDNLFPMGNRDFQAAGMMPVPMPSLFGGRDPFDDPFFTRPLGTMFDHGDGLFQPPTYGTSTAHAARSTGSKGLVIEELASDDEMEDVEGRQVRVDSGKHPSVEHPDDDPADERNHQDVIRASDHTRSNGRRTHGFSYSKVTYGGADGAYYTSTRSRHFGGDGVTIEESKEADKTTGQATHRVSRGINDKGHSVTRKLNPDGKVDTVQTLHNLDQDDLAGFEESWKGNHLPSFMNQFGMNDTCYGSGWSKPRELVANPSMASAFGRGSNIASGSESSGSRRPKKVVRINIE